MTKRKSAWVVFRDRLFNGLKTLFTKVIGFLRSNKELRLILNLAGKEIMEAIQDFEDNNSMSGAEKLSAIRKLVETILKESGIKMGKQIIHTVIENLLFYVRNK